MDATARFRLNQEMLDQVDEHAKRNRHSRSDQFRIIVEDWLMDRVADKHEVPDHTPEDVEQFLYPRGRLDPATTLIDTPESYNAQAGE